MGDEKFRRFMSEVFRRPGLLPTEVHKLLAQIPFAGQLTTNYDKLSESGHIVARQGEIPHVLTHADVSAALRSGEYYILKTHGTIDHIETVVLSRSQYRSLMQPTRRTARSLGRASLQSRCSSSASA